MPTPKAGFSLADHAAVATELHHCRQQLEGVRDRIKAQYSASVMAPALNALERALDHLQRATLVLRSELVAECTPRGEDGLVWAAKLYDHPTNGGSHG